MKKFFGLLVFLCSASFLAKAQSGEEKKLAEAVDNLTKAMLDANRSQLENIVTDQLSYGHSDGRVEDKTAFVEAIASGMNDFITMDIKDQTVKMAGNTALVRHILSTQVTDHGTTKNIKLGILLVWQKQAGKWKLLARQACKLS